MKRGWRSSRQPNKNQTWTSVVAGIAVLICLLNNFVQTVSVPDTKGTRFVFSTPFCSSSSTVRLLIVPQTTHAVNVTIIRLEDDSQLLYQTIPADDSLQHDLPCTTIQWGQTVTSGFLVTSSSEVTVYVENTDDSFMVFPDDVAGTSYAVTTFETSILTKTFVVIHGNDTEVAITLPNTLISTVTINGQQFSASAHVNVTLPVNGMLGFVCSCDLTGAMIVSSRSISVFVGSHDNDATNGVIEQLLPMSSWGKRFICSMSTWFASNVTLKISGTKLNTKLSIKTKDTSISPTFTSLPQLTLTMTINDFVSVEANETVNLAILYKIRDTSENFHVTMKVVPPIELYHITHMFTMSSTDAIYSNIITRSESFEYLTFNTIDGNPFDGAMTFFWEFYLCQGIHLTSPHTIKTNTLNKSPVMGSVIKISATSAYEYYLGMRITNLYDACVVTPAAHGGNGDGIDNDCDNKIDEETLNSVDDDNDGQIDEDVSYAGHISKSGSMDAWTYHQTHKEKETVFSNSFLSVIVSIVVALTAVAALLLGMFIAEKVRRSGSTRITPIYLEQQQQEPILQRY